jgi:C-terminal processing protease CtpA/Prc
LQCGGERVARQLPNGWVYSLVPQLVFVAEGVSYEGLGIPPDIEIQNAIPDINAGVDKVLEAGITILAGNDPNP